MVQEYLQRPEWWSSECDRPAREAHGRRDERFSDSCKRHYHQRDSPDMNKKHFFIYSLPRSGSAWLSLFFSQPGAFCIHEPLANEADVMEQLEERPEDCVGAIDTSAYAEPIVLPPEVPVYVLWRDWQDVEQSSLRMGFEVDVKTEQMVLVQNLKCTPANTIRYKDLGNLDYLEILWKEFVGTEFDRQRAEYLIEMRVERKIQSIVTRLRKWRTNI